MEPKRRFFRGVPPLAYSRARQNEFPRAGLWAGARPDRARHTTTLTRDLLGSWPFPLAVLALTAAGAALATLHDLRTGTVVVLGLIVSGLTLAAVSVVLMAARRADRIADEQILYELIAERQAQAVNDDILGQIEQINAGLARLAARIETLNIRCRAAGSDR
jgi:hypothetical protein